MLNLIIKPHAVIDKAICNNNAKDGMIHDIADYLTQQFKHIKGGHSVYAASYFWQTAQYNLLYSALASSQPHGITKSLFHNPFQVISATFYYNSWM